MLHLYHFESLLEHDHKVGPRMMSIQVGYNKNYHRKELDATINLMLDNCFEIWR